MSTDFKEAWDWLADGNGDAQRDADYATVAANADQLPLDAQEQYNVTWGPDATPEAWLRERAQAISDQINNADSTAVLRRGRNGAPMTQAEKDAEVAAAEAAKAGASAGEVNAILERMTDDRGGDGQSASPGTDPHGNGSTDGTNDKSYGVQGPGISVGNPVGALVGGVVGAVTGGLPGAVMGAAKYGGFSVSPGYSLGDPVNSRAARDARDAAEAGRSAGMDGASEGGAGSTAATADSPDGPDGNNAGQGYGGDSGGGGGSGDSGGTNSDGGTGDTGSDGNGGGGTGDGDSD